MTLPPPYLYHHFHQVMYDTYTTAGDPISTNKRANAAIIFSQPDVIAEEPWFIKVTRRTRGNNQGDL
ncbi:hypothetical protein FRX31_019102 [Thalictrum thalictroides]|uniref:Uncharacterized protein n=1 Tax=Thalictrum thalictroides TaxID=46969 RepID=A0A7J6W297_THATH|nr:hypothetical protein FRX31_019102 [Thalictrum thalictroides]